MKKILITGGTGFIGSHLVEMCVDKKFKVSCFDRYNPNYNLNNLENSKHVNNINFIFGDVRDFDSVNKAIKGHDYVFHLAALGGIPYSYESPLAYIKTNIEGTYNVLEASRLNNIKQLIVTSTSEVYGSPRKVPIKESHPLIGQSPYSASKIAADHLSISYSKSYNYKVKIIRPFNVYGPRQSLRAVIPTIISQSLNHKKTINLGNVNTSRDYTYVTDVCRAYFSMLNLNNVFGEPLNVGFGKDYKIYEIAKKIFTFFNPKLKIKKEKLRVRPTKSEVHRLLCDFTKFKKKTNWKPLVNMQSGLISTIQWFKKNRSKYPFKYQI